MNNPARVRGSVLVEFAIVLPMMLMLLFGITEIGRALYQLNSLTKAAVSGARYLARMNGAVEFDENNIICTQGAAWDAATARNIVVYGNETGSGDPILNDVETDFGIRASEVDIGGAETAGCVVTAEVAGDFVPLIGNPGGDVPFLGGAGAFPIRLTANVEERFIGE